MAVRILKALAHRRDAAQSHRPAQHSFDVDAHAGAWSLTSAHIHYLGSGMKAEYHATLTQPSGHSYFYHRYFHCPSLA
jgi:hypothetical protein